MLAEHVRFLGQRPGTLLLCVASGTASRAGVVPWARSPTGDVTGPEGRLHMYLRETEPGESTCPVAGSKQVWFLSRVGMGETLSRFSR